jgi:diguanylate cyclase (GGDEF)-like protein/PAS domain S-box-containing protein
MATTGKLQIKPGDSRDSIIRLVADSVPALIAYYEVDTLQCRFSNRRYAEYNGWTAQTILGKTVREAIGDAAYEKILPYVEKAMKGEASTYTREQILPSGTKRIIEVNLLPHTDESQTLHGCFVLINDITEHWRAEQAVRQSEERMRKFVAATNEGIVFHVNTLITDANEAIERITGYSRDEVIGRKTLEFIPVDLHPVLINNLLSGSEEAYEGRIVHKHGHEVPVELVAKSVTVDGEPCRLVVVRDISAQKAAQARIEFMALHDTLTQLPNRVYLMERLTSLLALARRRQGSMAVLFVDLDRFKNVNDSMGHHVGDGLLREVARRISTTVRDSDVVSRLGGDEFIVLLSDIASSDDAATVAGKLIENLGAAVDVEGHKLQVTASVGISIFPSDGESPDDLLRHADAAMYHAKESGRGNYQFFTPVLFARAFVALDMERHLKAALANGELVLHYQPQQRRSDGAIVALEALVRWNHPERGLVGPNEFIPFAEAHGLIGAIDHWVLHTACRQVKAWHAEGCQPVAVAVNLSAVDFRQRNMVKDIADVLQSSGLAPRYLQIEITESVLMGRDGRLLETLTALNRMGISMAIDDFGTGYSSLGYLKRYPINMLKIDQTFVKDITGRGDDLAIITAIIQMARSLNLETVAEGVETQAQLDVLSALGCDQFQGYLISHAVPAAEVRKFISHQPNSHTQAQTLM